MSVTATRDSRMEKRYRRLLVLYPKDHRREYAEEMVGVLLAADGDAPVRAPNPVAWAVRLGQHAADSRGPRRRRAADPRPDGAEPHPADPLAFLDGARPALE